MLMYTKFILNCHVRLVVRIIYIYVIAFDSQRRKLYATYTNKSVWENTQPEIYKSVTHAYNGGKFPLLKPVFQKSAKNKSCVWT